MDFRVNSSIASQLRQSYAIEGEDAFDNIEIDCAEGINIVSFSNAAIDAFNAIDYTIMKDYPHSLAPKKSIIDFWKKQTNVDLENENIVLCDGSISALFLLNKLFLEKDDEVLGLAPQFPEYGSDVLMFGAKFNTYTLKKEHNYKFMTDEFIELITDKLKLIYIDNPNNPTGQIIDIDDIEKIAKAAYDKNVALIIDEAYGDYMPASNSATTLIPKYENVIVVKTFSKAYGLAGLRGGYIILNKELNKYMKNICTPYNMSSITRAVAAKVVEDYDFILEMQNINAQMKDKIIKNYKNLTIAENAPTVSIMMVTHKNKDINLEQEFAKLKIGVVSCSSFESLQKNSIRFRFPSPKYLPKLIEAFDTIDNID